MRLSLRRLARLFPVIAIVVCACGDRDQAAPDATASDTAAVVAAADTAIKACDVIREDELEGILALDLDAGRTTNDYAGDSKCQWDLSGNAQRGVSISLRQLDDLELYRSVPGSADAPGLGEAAVWNATYGQLAVLQEGRVVSIALLVDDPEREHAERIARIALERI